MDMKIKLKNKEFLIFLAGGAVVLVVAVLLNNKGQFVPTDQRAVTPTEEEYPVDTVNDGVYTNHKYGFRFEYPEDKFKIVYSTEEYGSFIFDNDNGTEYIKLGADTLEGEAYESYKHLYEQNRKNQDSFYRVLDESRENGYKFSKIYSKTRGNPHIEHSSVFSAAWWINEKKVIYRLLFYSDRVHDDFVRENKAIFDEIVASFELID